MQVCVDDDARARAGLLPDEAENLCQLIIGTARTPVARTDDYPPACRQSGIPARAISVNYMHCTSALRDAGLELDTLSMGMTNDMEAAIMEGSTMIRIGTALFGARPG